MVKMKGCGCFGECFGFPISQFVEEMLVQNESQVHCKDMHEGIQRKDADPRREGFCELDDSVMCCWKTEKVDMQKQT